MLFLSEKNTAFTISRYTLYIFIRYILYSLVHNSFTIQQNQPIYVIGYYGYYFFCFLLQSVLLIPNYLYPLRITSINHITGNLSHPKATVYTLD